MNETDLYPPVKRYLEEQGYCVKSEIKNCDVVATRGDEPPIIIELKQSFTLPLLLQGIDRLAISDNVYLAIPAPNKDNPAKFWKTNKRDIIKLCRRLGLGLMSVETTRNEHGFVEVHADPVPYTPRKIKKREAALLKEFNHRAGDPNVGGSTRQPIVTAYRQDALRILHYLAKHNEAAIKDIKAATQVSRTSSILQGDFYGWFTRVSRGIYKTTPKGESALTEFADALKGITEEPN